MGWRKRLPLTQQRALDQFVSNEDNGCTLVQKRSYINLNSKNIVDGDITQYLYAYKSVGSNEYEFIWISTACEFIVDVRYITQAELQDFLTSWATEFDQKNGLFRFDEDEKRSSKPQKGKSPRTKK